MAWGIADDYLSQKEDEYKKKKLQEELSNLYESLEVDVNSYLKFYRKVQDYLVKVDKALDKLLGFPSALDTDKFYVRVMGGKVTITVLGYYEEGGELYIHANQESPNCASWSGPSSQNSFQYLDVPTFDASEDYLALNLPNAKSYVIEFNTDGMIIAYKNGIYSSIAYKYSMLEGKVVEWKC